MNRGSNCINCGAPLTFHGCEHCGTGLKPKSHRMVQMTAREKREHIEKQIAFDRAAAQYGRYSIKLIERLEFWLGIAALGFGWFLIYTLTQ